MGEFLIYWDLHENLLFSTLVYFDISEVPQIQEKHPFWFSIAFPLGIDSFWI